MFVRVERMSIIAGARVGAVGILTAMIAAAIYKTALIQILFAISLPVNESLLTRGARVLGPLTDAIITLITVIVTTAVVSVTNLSTLWELIATSYAEVDIRLSGTSTGESAVPTFDTVEFPRTPPGTIVHISCSILLRRLVQRVTLHT